MHLRDFWLRGQAKPRSCTFPPPTAIARATIGLVLAFGCVTKLLERGPNLDMSLRDFWLRGQ